MRKLLVSGCTLLVVATAGCGSSATKTTSTVSGTAALGTFPSAPVSVIATDETAHAVSSRVASDGRFSLTLAKGHTYRLSFAGADEVPLVLPRSSGGIKTGFRLSTGGAQAELGAVRYFATAPSSGFHFSTNTAKSASQPAGDAECEDGVLAGTTTPCVDDDGKVKCDDGSEVDDGDGECVDGKDAKTGAACTDPPESTDQADVASPMAIADKNLPDDVSGCAEEENDGEEKD